MEIIEGDGLQFDRLLLN